MDMRVVIHKKLLNLNFSHKIIFLVAAATAAVCFISPCVLPYSNRLKSKPTMGFHQPLPPPSLPHSAFSESAHYNFLPLKKKNPLFSHSPQKTKQKKIQNHKLSAAHTPLPTYIITNKHKEEEIKPKQNLQTKFQPLKMSMEENEGKTKRKPNL
jgi:hypothetical protein